VRQIGSYLQRVSLPAWGKTVALTGTDLWHYMLVTGVAATILAFRQPSRLLHPQFVVEDGTIFFAQARNLHLVDALTRTYAGYWHAVPRVVAELGALLPLRWDPLFYAASALLLTAAAISWLLLPLHRSLIASDRLRLLVVFLILLIPILDGLMLLAYVQWYLAFWAVLIVFAPMPRPTWTRWPLAVTYVFVALTAPVVGALLPLWLLRSLTASSGEQRRWSGVITAVSLLAVSLVMAMPGHLGSISKNLPMAIEDLARAISLKVFTITAVGATFGRHLVFDIGWWTVYLVAIALAALLVAAYATDRRSGMRLTGMWIGYIAVASALPYLVRSADYRFPYVNYVDAPPFVGSRYFIIAALLFVLAAAIQIERALQARPQFARVVVVAAGLLAVSYFGSYRYGDWPESDWPAYAQMLSDVYGRTNSDSLPVHATAPLSGAPSEPMYARTDRYPVGDKARSTTPRPSYLADTYAVRVPATFPDFHITLFVPDRQAGIADFPEGLRLLDYHVDKDSEDLYVDLFWIGDSKVAGTNDQLYTTSVHVLNDEGERLAGSDALLSTDDMNRLPEDVIHLRHTIDLAEATPAGTYDLAIGLYRPAHAGLVPGSFIAIPHAFSWL
jgi:hypothetical protein